MNEPNDPKLKRAVAEMLPEVVRMFGVFPHWFAWAETDCAILETEWLYIVSLAEKTLKESEWVEYLEYLLDDVCEETCDLDAPRAQWQQATSNFNTRARAMCRIKEVES